MLFSNPELIQILQEYYRWTDIQVQAMAEQYTNTMIKLIIDESVVYIEKNKLPDMEELNKLLQENIESKKNIKTQINLMEFALSLHTKHPRLEKIITERIQAINQDLMSGLMEDIDEATAVKIMKIAEKDIDSMDKFVDKLKTWGIEFDQKNNNYQEKT